MKRIRASNRLSDLRCRRAQKGVHEDGEGLRLLVDVNGRKRWVLRVTIRGKRVCRGLGSYPLTGLAEARDRALEIRKAARDGMDKRFRNVSRVESTFEEAAERYLEEIKRPALKPEYADVWLDRLRNHVFPAIGSIPISALATPQVIEALRPVWRARRETAGRCLQRISAISRWSVLVGLRTASDPTAGVAEVLGRDRRPVEHRKALNWRDVPEFIANLRAREAATLQIRLCIEMAVLAGARSMDVRLADWQEFDIASKVWRLPASRAKTRRDHHVPLTSQMLKNLERAAEFGTAGYVYKAPSGGAFWDAALSKCCRTNTPSCSLHGFRSSLKQWCSEHDIDDLLSEALLAHIDGNRVRAAYLREHPLERRLEVLQQWNNFICPNKGGHLN